MSSAGNKLAVWSGNCLLMSRRPSTLFTAVYSVHHRSQLAVCRSSRLPASAAAVVRMIPRGTAVAHPVTTVEQ